MEGLLSTGPTPSSLFHETANVLDTTVCCQANNEVNMSSVKCHMSGVKGHLFSFFLLLLFDEVVELIGGGSVINGAFPV